VPPGEPKDQSEVLKTDPLDELVHHPIQKQSASLLIPEDGGQAEDFLRDCPYTVVGITIWGSPVSRQTASLERIGKGSRQVAGKCMEARTVEL
jgi:hypothetical protein